MDWRLEQACMRGDLPGFLNLVQENEDILSKTTAAASNNALHIASRFGWAELVGEIVRLRPDFVLAENEKQETPCHEACREGGIDVLMLLMESNPWVVYKLNKNGESGLFLACGRGHVDLVKHLLSRSSFLLACEEDGMPASLHAAVSGGFAEIVREILQVRPDTATKRDGQGSTPLHIAAGKGYLEIARELLKVEPEMCLVKDHDGRTPLHAAAVKGRVSVLDEIISVSLDSARLLTNLGETAIHLSVRHNKYEAVRYLVEKLFLTSLINAPDHNGNTVLHLATGGRLIMMVRYLVGKTEMEINALNNSGMTALDLVGSDANSSGVLGLITALEQAGGKRSGQLQPRTPETKGIVRLSPPPLAPTLGNSPDVEQLSQHTNSLDSAGHSNRHPRHVRRRRRLELHREGLQNARNTITVVAVLIATVTFAASLNPPGGVHQDSGPLLGKAALGRTPAFKVFMVCNHVALFSSLGIVIVLVSIIPFRRKSMMKLLVLTHKVMWVAVSFMAVAYMAGSWVIVPGGKGVKWLLWAMVGIGGGGMVTIFVGLGMLLVKQWARKMEWKKKRKLRKRGSPAESRVDEMRDVKKKGSSGSSYSSDLDSSETSGYIMY